MPELLIDQGNTRLKLGWLSERLDYLGTTDLSGIASSVPERPQRIWLSSVAAVEPRDRLRAALQALPGELVEVSVQRFSRHLPTRYAEQQLGVDRWLGALAGYERAGDACVVVDAGTATTIDAVDANGMHLGGYILPGEALMFEALREGTAIPLHTESAECTDRIPLGTQEAMHCAGLAAQAALIERLRSRLGQDCQVFLGGGNRESLLPFLQSAHAMIPHLVLQGLACLARREK